MTMKKRGWTGLLAALMLAGLVCFFGALDAWAEDAQQDAAQQDEIQPDVIRQGLIISEACADNEFVWTLDFQDYLELYNDSSEEVNLGDYSIKVKQKTARLPEKTVAPGAYCVVVCDGTDLPSLSKSGCAVSLLNADGGVKDSVILPASQCQVWLRDEGLGYVPSPGYPNTAEGAADWHRSVCGDLTVTETLPANFIAVRTTREKQMDVMEIRNASEQSVNLSGYYLSDSRKDLRKYRMPSQTLKAGEYCSFYCTDSTDDRHTGFKLSAEGEVVYISKADGTVVDALNIPPLTVDVSYGRTDHVTGYFSQPTLGRENATLYPRRAEPPTLSVSSSGGHTEAFTVRVRGEGPFYYTTDGSEPTAASELYQNGIRITATTTLRVIAKPTDAAPSRPVTALYRFDTQQFTLPTLTISLTPACLTDLSYGLLRNTEDRELEVPAVITFLNPDGSVKFAQECGFSIAGQTSRPRTNRGWKVTFRSKYGKANLDCQVFDDFAADSFDSLVLRLGTNGNPLHDILGTATGKDACTEVLYQHYRPVNLFINKRFYGIYYLREHVNANFIVNHLGGDEDEVDMIYNVSQTKLGSNEDWLALVQYCRTHSLADQSCYDYVASRIDVQSFIDYFIWRPYTGDSDHPNIRYVRSRKGEDPRWHIVIYDMDWAFQNAEKKIGLNRYTYKLYDEEKHNNVVIFALLKNPGFRQAFLERLSYHMRVTFDPNRMRGLVDKINQEVEHDLPFMQKDWSDSVALWKRSITSVKQFITSGGDRRSLLLRETKSFFSLTNEQMQQYFGNIPY